MMKAHYSAVIKQDFSIYALDSAHLMASVRIINFCYSPSVVQNEKEINFASASLCAEWFETDVMWP